MTPAVVRIQTVVAWSRLFLKWQLHFLPRWNLLALRIQLCALPDWNFLDIAAPSPASCTPCGIGQYSHTLGSQTCTSCGTNKCTTIGSITPSPSSPSEAAFNLTILDRNGNPVTAASPFVVGLVYVGLFAGFVLVSGLVAIIFQKKLRRPVLAASVILRTPAAILRVVHSSDTLVEVPSFFRGIVGIWASGCWVA